MKGALSFILWVGIALHTAYAQSKFDDPALGNLISQWDLQWVNGQWSAQPQPLGLLPSPNEPTLLGLSKDLLPPIQGSLGMRPGLVLRDQPIDLVLPTVAPCDPSKVECSLPELFPVKFDYQGMLHLIFWDDTRYAQENSPSLHQLWEAQTRVLVEKILAMGVPPQQIRVVGVSSLWQFLDEVRRENIPKRIYTFGHADAQQILYGETTIDLRRYYGFLTKAGVRVITNYGCSFVAQRQEEVFGFRMRRSFTDRLTPDLGHSKLLLYGHTQVSYGDRDDSPADPSNPLVQAVLECEVDGSVLDDSCLWRGLQLPAQLTLIPDKPQEPGWGVLLNMK